MFGEKRSVIATIIQTGPFLIPIVFLPLVVYTGSIAASVCVVLCIFGAGLIIHAKIPQLKQGQFLNFGWSKLDPKQKWTYSAGYILLAIGLTGCIAVLYSRI
jgi:hypothetical protein